MPDCLRVTGLRGSRLVHRVGRASLGWTLVTSCLEEWETHPQEKDHGTRKGDWQVKVKNAMTQVAARAAKWLTKWLI